MRHAQPRCHQRFGCHRLNEMRTIRRKTRIRCPVITRRYILVGRVRARAGGMVVQRHLGDGKRMLRLTTGLTPDIAGIIPVHRHPAPEIGQIEISPSIPAKRGPQQLEQRRVRSDGKRLSITLRPSPGSKIETKDADL